MTTNNFAVYGKTFPFLAFLNLLSLHLLLIAIFISCSPCCAQAVHVDPTRAIGINRLREHVIKIPSREIVAEKDTVINEPVHLQKVLGTQLFRGYSLNSSEQAFYSLDNDWNFQKVSSSLVPARPFFEPEPNSYDVPQKLSNISINGKLLRGEPQTMDSTIYKDGMPISSIKIPTLVFGTSFFFDNGRSLLFGLAIIRDVTKPKLETFNPTGGPWFGDPRLPTLYSVGRIADSHLCLFRFDSRVDKTPFALCDLGTDSDPPKFTNQFDWSNGGHILIDFSAQPPRAIDLHTRRVLARPKLSYDYYSAFSIAQGASNRYILYGKQIIDLTSGATTPVPELAGVARFSQDGRYLFYAAQKEGTPGFPTEVRVFDIAGRKSLGRISLNSRVASQSSGSPHIIRDIIVANREHLIVLTGSSNGYYPNPF